MPRSTAQPSGASSTSFRAVANAFSSEGRDAHAGQIRGHPLQALVIAVGEVRIGIAVMMHVDKARDHRSPVEINGVLRHILRQNLSKNSVFYLKCPQMKMEIRGKDPCVLKKHGIHSFSGKFS